MNYKNFVIDLAYKAGERMRKDFVLGMKKEWKKDKTPVTVTDIFVNQLVIDSISKKFPEHSILAEEISNLKDSEHVWVCDPIDGTVPFSHGTPTFGFSLALVHDGEPKLGVLYDPILDRMIYAEEGKGAFLNGKRVKVSPRKTLPMSVIDIGDRRMQYAKLVLSEKDVHITRMASCVYAGLLLAAGEYTGVVYSYQNPWDAAGVKIAVEEAGGKVTDLLGKEQRYDRPIN